MSKSHKKINVRGLVEINDPTYRYTMEPLKLVTQNTKTVITNLAEIGKNLSVVKVKSKLTASATDEKDEKDESRDQKPFMIIEYFKKRFGTSIKHDKELTKVEIKGVSQQELQDALYEFIEYFVICPTCRNPETILSKKKSQIMITCQACSHHDKLKCTNKFVLKVTDNVLKLID